MRVFGGDRVKSLMGTFGIPEDQPIEMKLISKQLESAQTRIEGFHFDSRKQVLAYDDVLNLQRITIYKRRRKLLYRDADELARIKEELVAGTPTLAAVLEAKATEYSAETMDTMFSQLCLQIIDNLWVDHLEMMSHIRSSVNLRAYGQRDPLIEYRREGTIAFTDLQATIQGRIGEALPNMQPAVIAREEVEHQKEAEAAIKASEAGGAKQSATPRTAQAAPGRNDMVTITNGTETETVKYKKAEAKLAQGWRLVP